MVTYLAIQPVLAHHGLVDPSIGTIIAGTVAAAGGALLPAFDHPEATIAQSLGPVTKLLARVLLRSRVDTGTEPIPCLA